MTLTLHAYKTPDLSEMIADWSHSARGVSFTTGEHGYEALTAFVPLQLGDAFRYYDATPASHIVLSNGAFRAFEGRIEDRAIVDGGLQVTAFGYWREMYDFPYTALWSTKRFDGFRLVTEADSTNFTPARWQKDNQDRIYMAPLEDAGFADEAQKCGYLFMAPHNSVTNLGGRKIAKVTFDYAVDLPTDWDCRMTAFDEPIFTSGVDEWTVTTSGSGSADVDLTAAKDGILFQAMNATGGADTYTGGTGDKYIKITNIRIWTTTADAIYADAIVEDIIDFVSGFSETGYTRMSSATYLVNNPSTDLYEELYEDVPCAKILNNLALRGDNSTLSQLYEVGVWEDRILYFRKKGSAGQDWYTDVTYLMVDSTIDTLHNSAYGLYRGTDGRLLRTNLNYDNISKAHYGITRRAVVPGNSTNSTQAGIYRDAYLEDNKDIKPRAQFMTRKLYTASGAPVPLWMARAGDTVTLRNLPLGLGETADRIRSFRVSRTEYDVDYNVLSLTPEEPLPSLAVTLGELAGRFAELGDYTPTVNGRPRG